MRQLQLYKLWSYVTFYIEAFLSYFEGLAAPPTLFIYQHHKSVLRHHYTDVSMKNATNNSDLERFLEVFERKIILKSIRNLRKREVS